MSFVGELLDANIKKEMSEEMKDFEANVSIIFNLNLNVGIHSKTVRMGIHVFRCIICV